MSAAEPPIARHRARVEAVLRVAAPLLDLVLATGDRLSRTFARGDDDDDVLPLRFTDGRTRAVGPGAEGGD